MAGAGTLIAVGGGEDKKEAMLILRRALDHAAEGRRVAIIPSASANPIWASELHVEAFKALGAAEVDVVDIRTRDQAALEDCVDRIRKADLVYMTGGCQTRLTSLLLDTPVFAALVEKLADGGVVAGTSAGAAAMSAVMVMEGDANLRKGGVRLGGGFGLVPHAIIDTHFAERGRFGRLLEAVATHPGLVGIGLGEDAAIVIRGHDVEVVGSGTVVIVEGREMTYTSVAHVEENQPVDIERIVMHVLTPGRCWRMPQAADARGAGSASVAA